MLQKPLVVITGAGASYAFGYPLGAELVRRIYDLKGLDSPFIRELNLTGPFDDLIEAIEGLDHSSIDRVLQTRDELWPVGRIAITECLLKCENIKNLSLHTGTGPTDSRTQGRWYGKFFELLTARVQDFPHFASLPISFVTFNYDRSFDYFFWRWLHKKWPKDGSKIDEYLLNRPIIHLHGQFGKLPFQLPKDQRSEAVEYASHESLSVEQLKRVSEGIRIVHDDTLSNSDEFTAARLVLGNAAAIVILGFGYDDVNFKRLSLHRRNRQVAMYSTAFGESPGGHNRIRQMLAAGNDGAVSGMLGPTSQGIKDFLGEIWPDLTMRLDD
ncbi:MAG TPA: hypothetical protein VG055_20155 [Planctomycetaceae bacterium]|jgi:hypothetical protein|nr:hypothetical protein [Planctomycetaceae bacterium]